MVKWGKNEVNISGNLMGVAVVPTNIMLTLIELVANRPLDNRKWHINDDHKDSIIQKKFSAEARASALEDMNKEFDTSYTTHLGGVNKTFQDYLNAREKQIPNGMKDKVLKGKFNALTPDTQKLATLIGDTEKTTKLKALSWDDKKEISINEFYDRINLIKEQMKEQLDADIKHIESLFPEHPNPKSAFQTALEAMTPPMDENQIDALKTEMLAVVNDAHKTTTKTINDELKTQYTDAENYHNVLETLAAERQTSEARKTEIDDALRNAVSEQNHNKSYAGVTTSINGAISKLDKETFKTAAETLLVKTVKVKEGYFGGWHEESQGFKTSTGLAIKYDKKSGQCEARFPARIPYGPGMQFLAKVVYDTELSGNPLYYHTRQDNMKYDCLSMAEKLWDDGFRTAEISIDHNPRDPEQSHARDFALKAFVACCETGFKPEDLTFKINGHPVPLIDERNDKGEVTKKGLFKTEGAMKAAANIAGTQKTAKENARESAYPQMTPMKNAVKALHAQEQAEKEKAEKEKKAEKENDQKPSLTQ